MSIAVIQNFKQGLDSRRSVLTSQAGTLVTLENAHLTQGAEIEQRKAFTLLGTLPSQMFGAQETSATIYTFGSAANNVATTFRQRTTNVATLTVATNFNIGDVVVITGVGGVGYNGTFTLTSVTATTIQYVSIAANEGLTADVNGRVNFSIITGFTYQQLQHFIKIVPGTYIGEGTPTMTAVTHSCAYDDKPFAIATFSASGTVPIGTQCFYDGSNVIPNAIGTAYVVNGAAIAKSIEIYLSSYLDNFTVVNLIDTDNNIYITGPLGQDYTLDLEDTSGGLMTSTVYGQAQGVTLALGAVVSFYITGGAAGQVTSITAPNVVSGAISGTVALLTGAVAYNASILQTAIDVATAINANTATGYTAQATLASNNSTKVAKITITAPPLFGAVVNAQGVEVVTTTMTTNATSVPASGAVGTNSYPLGSGVDGFLGLGKVYKISFSSSDWTSGSTWTITIVMNGIVYTIGSGLMGGITASFCLSMGQKVYVATGKRFNFSAVDDASKWEVQNTGAGEVLVKDVTAAPTDVVALAHYQKKLAVFCRRLIQLWNIDADPANYSQGQLLPNLGTIAKLSVQSIGDMEVMFLSDSGFRSLQVRDASLNARVVDIGSPIDAIIQAALLTAGVNTTACGIMEPSSNRYWCYLKGKIYVLTYFPELKIVGWSTYLPTYAVAGVQTTFIPVKFFVKDGQVYVLASDNKVFLYGGADNNTYDGCPVTVETPWLDHSEMPVNKQGLGVKGLFAGKWTVSAGMDPVSGTLETVFTKGSAATPNTAVDSAIDGGHVAYRARGSHFKLKAVSDTTNVGKVSISALLFIYDKLDNV